MVRQSGLRRNLLLAIGLIVFAAAGCDFDTLTEAEDQLNRGPLREYEFEVPVVQDTFVLGDIFDSLGVDLDTLPDGLLAVVPDTINFILTIPVTVPSLMLDTVVTPEPVWETVDSAMLNLGQFTDAIAASTLNTALVGLNISNSADAPVEFVNYRLGVVPVVGGQLDSVGGQPAFVTDGGGMPIVVDLVDPGDTVFALGRMQTGKVDSLLAGPVVDVLISRVLAGDTVALVGVGDLHIGDGTTISVTAGDFLAISVVPIVGLDLTVGVGGAPVSMPTFVEKGLGIGADWVSDLQNNVLDSVGVGLVVENGVAFGLQIETAVVGQVVAGDVFSAPGAILDTIAVAAAAVDANGMATAATPDSSTIVITPAELGQTTGDSLSIGVRITLLPPPGGRGRVQAADGVRVIVFARIWVHVGSLP